VDQGIRYKVLVSVSSRIDYIDVVEELAANLGQAVGFTEEVFEIKLAVREAVANAVLHGNKAQAGKLVHLEFLMEDEGLAVRIRDEGPGFRIEEIPDPTRAENLLKPTGRGVLLIRNLMDEVDFSRTAEAGGEVVMVKRRSPAEAAGS